MLISLLFARAWKCPLTRRLYEQGYEWQDIPNLLQFSDWMLELPEGLKQAFRAELTQYEQEGQMPYVTSIEQKRRKEERQAIACNMLRKKYAFGGRC